MSHGIAIVGANGSGKTTLGKYLAGLLSYKYMDIEAYSFKESKIPYANPRVKEEVRELLLTDIRKQDSFILSAVNCDFGDEINAMYDCVVYVKAPLELRLRRVRQRSISKFGSRVLEGGSMCEQEEEFYNFVAVRTMEKTDAWLQSVECPVICVEGRKRVADNAKRIIKECGIKVKMAPEWRPNGQTGL